MSSIRKATSVSKRVEWQAGRVLLSTEVATVVVASCVKLPIVRPGQELKRCGDRLHINTA